MINKQEDTEENTMNSAKILNLLRKIWFVLNFILVVLVFILALYPFIYSEDTSNFITHILYVSTIGIQIGIILINNMYEKKVNEGTLPKSKNEVISFLKRATKSTVEDSRAELRRGLRILLYTIIFILVILVFMGINIYLICGVGFLVVIAFIYADYLPHADFYAKRYDSRYVIDGEPSAIRGLARIYFDEYKFTGLDVKDDWYLRIENKPIYEEGDNEKYAKGFIKCVFWAYLDSIVNSMAILSWSMVVVTGVFFYSPLCEMFMRKLSLDGKMYDLFYLLLSLLPTVLFLLISGSQIIGYERKANIIADIFRVEKENNLKIMIKEYENIMKKEDGALYKVRGQFMFSMKMMDEKISMSDIPFKYRMLYIHRAQAHLPRLKSTLILGWFAGVSIFISMFGASWYLLGTIVLIFPIYWIIKIGMLPVYGKQRILKECKKME